MTRQRHLRKVLAGLMVSLVLVIYFQLPKFSTCCLTEARYDHEATLLKDGRVLVTGGRTVVESHPYFRDLHFLTFFPVIGRYIPWERQELQPADCSEILDPKTWTWHFCEAPTAYDGAGSAMLLEDGRVFRQLPPDIYQKIVAPMVFDPVRERWEAAPSPSKPGDCQHWNVLVDQSMFPIIDFPGPLWVDPTTGHYNWIPITRYTQPGIPCWVVQIDARTVLFGIAHSIENSMKYDVPTEKWSPADGLPIWMEGSRAVRLLGGDVLLSGGGCYQSESWIYETKTGKWIVSDSMNVARTGHTATVLPNGRVLITGGLGADNVVTATCELFDPATMKWSLTGALHQARMAHTATLLPSGKVLVIGGSAVDVEYPERSNRPLSTCELYDPATGTWTLL